MSVYNNQIKLNGLEEDSKLKIQDIYSQIILSELCRKPEWSQKYCFFAISYMMLSQQ